MISLSHHHKAGRRPGKRFLRLLSPGHQLSANPVLGLAWLLAVLCTALVPVLFFMGLPGWVGVAMIAGLLWLNALAASVCEFFFGKYDSESDRRQNRW